MKLPTHTSTKLFGMACTPEQASIVVIPVPWEVTVSSRSGTSLGPEGVLKASLELKGLEQCGVTATRAQAPSIAMLPIPYDWKALSETLRHDTLRYIHSLESGF